MTYQDLVEYVAAEFLEEIKLDCPCCEKFSEYTDMMQMPAWEVKEEFIALADFGIKELKEQYPGGFLHVDSYSGSITSDEFDEEVPYRTFKRDVVKIINEALK